MCIFVYISTLMKIAYLINLLYHENIKKSLYVLLILLTKIRLTACVWFVPSVCPLVFFKITFVWESLVTVIAFVWLLPSMCPHMSNNMTILWKRLVTQIAFVPFLPVCVLRWVLRFSLSEKALSHWLQFYALLWRLSWLSSLCVSSYG